MKKLIKTMLVAVLIATSVEANTLEDYDKNIANANNPVLKQNLICEREAGFILKDPIKCIKAAQISSKEFDTIKYGGYDDYKYYLFAMYHNAGIIYNKIGDDANEVKMYKKTLEFLPNHDTINYNLGLYYYYGKGVKTNKIKAYEHWRVAAKQGYQDAQRNLDILCKESPWACK